MLLYHQSSSTKPDKFGDGRGVELGEKHHNDSTGHAESHLGNSRNEVNGLLHVEPRNALVAVASNEKDKKELSMSSSAVTVQSDSDFEARVQRASISAALAIALHNIPEGIVSFVAAVNSLSLGVALCASIAMHNIPEGMSIAAPVFYATGSKWKAFGVTFFAGGLSELTGALIGYAVIKNQRSSDGFLFGALYAATAGVMAYLTIVCALPAAALKDPSGRTTPICFFIGVVIVSFGVFLGEVAES